MYKVSTGAVGDVVCVTCGTLNADSKECTYNTIEFSTDMGHYVHGCDGPHAPRSVIKEAAVRNLYYFQYLKDEKFSFNVLILLPMNRRIRRISLSRIMKFFVTD
jgi:hypothetical protein